MEVDAKKFWSKIESINYMYLWISLFAAWIIALVLNSRFIGFVALATTGIILYLTLKHHLSRKFGKTLALFCVVQVALLFYFTFVFDQNTATQLLLNLTGTLR